MREIKRWLWLALLVAAAVVLLPLGSLVDRPQQTADDASLGLLLVDEADGLYVLAVSAGSAADQAGFRPGDRILDADGAPVSTSAIFYERLLTAPSRLHMTVRRQERVLQLVLPCR